MRGSHQPAAVTAAKWVCTLEYQALLTSVCLVRVIAGVLADDDSRALAANMKAAEAVKNVVATKVTHLTGSDSSPAFYCR